MSVGQGMAYKKGILFRKWKVNEKRRLFHRDPQMHPLRNSSLGAFFGAGGLIVTITIPGIALYCIVVHCSSLYCIIVHCTAL